MNKLSQKKGFTMVELMVVISIISILSIIGTVVYSGVQVQSRDNKRINDVRVIESALEQYYTDQGAFPFTLTVTSGQPLPHSAGVMFGTNLSTTYLSEVPKDPLAGAASQWIYSYNAYNWSGKCSDTSCTRDTCFGNGSPGASDPPPCNLYCLYFNLEKPPSGAQTFNPLCIHIASLNYEVDSQTPNKPLN